MAATPDQIQLISMLAGGALASLVVIVLVFRTRRRFAGWRRVNKVPPAALDLADLHAMLQAGTITPLEFERLKAVISRQFATRHAPNATLDRARGFDVLPPIDDLD
jgi:hypothetical protein